MLVIDYRLKRLFGYHFHQDCGFKVTIDLVPQTFTGIGFRIPIGVQFNELFSKPLKV